MGIRVWGVEWIGFELRGYLKCGVFVGPRKWDGSEGGHMWVSASLGDPCP